LPSAPDAHVCTRQALQLQLFKTRSRGWGLRTLTPVRKRQYVCEYIGEIISEEIAERRGEGYDKNGASYLWTPDEGGECPALL